MFTRLRSTIHILSYREEQTPPDRVPDIQFVDHEAPQYSKFSHSVARFVGFWIVLFIVGATIPLVTDWLTKATGKPIASITAIGITGAVMFYLLNDLIGRLHSFLGARLGTALTPHLGHKLHETYRILRS